MKRSAMWWEGAEWAAALIGQTGKGEALGVCDGIESNLATSDKPEQYKAGARALVEVARYREANS